MGTCNRLAYLRTFFGHSEITRIVLTRVWEFSKQLKHLDPCQVDTNAIISALEQSKDSIDKSIWARWVTGKLQLNQFLQPLELDEEALLDFVENIKIETIAWLKEDKGMISPSVLENFLTLPRDDKINTIKGIVCASTKQDNGNLIDSLKHLPKITIAQSKNLKEILVKKVSEFQFKDHTKIWTMMKKIQEILGDPHTINSTSTQLSTLFSGNLPQMEVFIDHFVTEMKSGIAGIKTELCYLVSEKIEELMTEGHDRLAAVVINNLITNNQLDYDKLINYVDQNLDLDKIEFSSMDVDLSLDSEKTIPLIVRYNIPIGGGFDKYFLRDNLGLSHLGDALVNQMVVKISLVGYVFGGLPKYYGLW